MPLVQFLPVNVKLFYVHLDLALRASLSARAMFRQLHPDRLLLLLKFSDGNFDAEKFHLKTTNDLRTGLVH